MIGRRGTRAEPSIPAAIASRLEENRDIIVAFNVDARSKYKLVSDIMDQPREANAVDVMFTSHNEPAEAP
jgi:biopolymer transport protein ExbD